MIITEDQKMAALAMLHKATKFDHEAVLRRYEKEYGVPPQYAEVHWQELCKYLVLCATFSSPIEMRGQIDRLWHVFLVFTKRYNSFCQSILGVFVHHTPSEDATQTAESKISFSEAYFEIFGSPPPKSVWSEGKGRIAFEGLAVAHDILENRSKN